MNGRQMKELHNAFIERFDPNSLTQLIRFRLDKDLDQLVPAGSFKDRVFELIVRAEREGWLGQLIDAVAKDRPTDQVSQSLRSDPQLTKTKPGQEEPGGGDRVKVAASAEYALLIDPGTAPPEVIAKLLAEFSKLYRMVGGSGIDFRPTEVRVLEGVS